MSNQELVKFASLFNDELTLDNLDRVQLVSMCQLLNIPPFGTDGFLKQRLRSHLENIRQVGAWEQGWYVGGWVKGKGGKEGDRRQPSRWVCCLMGTRNMTRWFHPTDRCGCVVVPVTHITPDKPFVAVNPQTPPQPPTPNPPTHHTTHLPHPSPHTPHTQHIQEDRLIQAMGLDNLTPDELRSAIKARGMRAMFGPGAEVAMRQQMQVGGSRVQGLGCGWLRKHQAG